MQIQQIELLSRLRRLLGFRGSPQLDVSALMSPVVMTYDATGIPFRQEGRRFQVGGGVAAVVGQSVDMTPLIDPPAVGVLDYVTLTNQTATAQLVTLTAGSSNLLLGTTFNGYSLEGAQDAFTITTTRNIPVIAEARQDATASARKILRRVWVPPNGSVDVPLDFPLGDRLTTQPLTVRSADGNGLEAHFCGRFWPSLP